jgi:hypothetical protein
MHLAERGTSRPGGASPSKAKIEHEPWKAQFFAKHFVKVKVMALDGKKGEILRSYNMVVLGSWHQTFQVEFQ